MKRTALMCTCLLALLATPCRADTEFHGVLAPRAYSVVVDTAFVHAAPPAVDTFLTPGWQGDSTVALDSFDFPDVANWPVYVELAVRVDGMPGRQYFIEPVSGLWNLFEGFLPPAPEVMFWAPTGIEVPGPAVPVALLSVVPSVARSHVRFELSGSGGTGTLAVFDAAGNRVRTFNVDREGWSVLWTGDDDRGRPLPGGAYFCRLVEDGTAPVRKVLLAR